MQWGVAHRAVARRTAGFTLMDPLVSILVGFLVYNEATRTGAWLGWRAWRTQLARVGAALLAALTLLDPPACQVSALTLGSCGGAAEGSGPCRPLGAFRDAVMLDRSPLGIDGAFASCSCAVQSSRRPAVQQRFASGRSGGGLAAISFASVNACSITGHAAHPSCEATCQRPTGPRTDGPGTAISAAIPRPRIDHRNR